MKQTMQRLYDTRRRDLTRLGLVCAVALLCGLRLLLAAQGRLYLEPENSPIDDQLMYNAARSIGAGQWLGAYGYCTIGKHMFFSVWLAGVHALGLPYLVANTLLLLAAGWVCAAALAPVLHKRLWVLAAFFLLTYCPVGFDKYNYRVYRDSITVALLLLAFGGFIGLVLRLTDGARSRWGYAVAGGLGLGASWLNREDGVWLLPFCVCLLVFGILVLCRQRGLRGLWRQLGCLCLPFLLLGGCLAAYAGCNQAYYGRFLLSDLTSRDFTTAYGMLAGIADKGTGACRPVTRATRQTLYDNSDFFAALQPYWEDRMVLNGYGSVETGEYGGSYYYALRLSNSLAGQYQDAAETKAFYEQMAAELERLERQGVIAISHFHASTVPYWRGEYLAPTLSELAKELGMGLFCTGFDPTPRLSVYSRQELVDEMCAYLKGDIVHGYQEGTDQPYCNLLQRAAFLAERVLCWVWRVFSLAGLCAGVWWAVAGWRRGMAVLFGRRAPGKPEETAGRGTPAAQKTPTEAGAKPAAGQALAKGKQAPPDADFWRWVLVWGLGLSAVLRCALMSYMEVTVFRIGGYLMYLSTAVPLFGLAGLLALRQAAVAYKEYKEHKEKTS